MEFIFLGFAIACGCGHLTTAPIVSAPIAVETLEYCPWERAHSSQWCIYLSEVYAHKHIPLERLDLLQA